MLRAWEGADGDRPRESIRAAGCGKAGAAAPGPRGNAARALSPPGRLPLQPELGHERCVVRGAPGAVEVRHGGPAPALPAAPREPVQPQERAPLRRAGQGGAPARAPGRRACAARPRGRSAAGAWARDLHAVHAVGGVPRWPRTQAICVREQPAAAIAGIAEYEAGGRGTLRDALVRSWSARRPGEPRSRVPPPRRGVRSPVARPRRCLPHHRPAARRATRPGARPPRRSTGCCPTTSRP